MTTTKKRAGFASAIAVLVVYVASVIGYFWLDSSAAEIAPANLDTVGETVVLVELTTIRPMDDTLDATVQVLPKRSMLDEFGALNTDLTVRVYPSSDFGELSYGRGNVPGLEKVSINLFGDADRWPFDTFSTGTISADVVAGSGESRRFIPARVEVAGSLNGWNISSRREAANRGTGLADQNTTITFDRARGPLALIAGFCLVLLALPAIALYVSIEMLLGRKLFQPAFSTFFASMLFAVVPIRNVMPGSPPAGSWIDEAITVWVLIALVAATIIYVIAWVRRAD